MSRSRRSQSPLQRLLEILLSCAFCATTACGGASGSDAPATNSYEVGVGRVGDLGKVLVDARGRTLYIYIPDRRGPSKCYGLCAVQWPPLLLPRGATAPTLGHGVQQGLVGEVRRTNGSRQVTYNGWPLYAYRLDSRPGQASGEEDDMGLWVAMAPSGQGIR